MIDCRTHDLMALSSVQAYTHIAMECIIWACKYSQIMEGDEDRTKQLMSIHDQLDVLYQVGLREVLDAERAKEIDGKEEEE